MDRTEQTSGSGSTTRRTVLKGAVGATVGAGVLSGRVSASVPCEGCVPLGKYDGMPTKGDEYVFWRDGAEYTITIPRVCEEDGEVVGVVVAGLPSNRFICRIDVKGGPETATYYPEDVGLTDGFGIANTGTCVFAPRNDRNRNRTYYEISNVTFYVCTDGKDGKDDEDGKDGADGEDGKEGMPGEAHGRPR